MSKQQYQRALLLSLLKHMTKMWCKRVNAPLLLVILTSSFALGQEPEDVRIATYNTKQFSRTNAASPGHRPHKLEPAIQLENTVKPSLEPVGYSGSKNIFTSPNKLYSLSWDAKQWKKTDALPTHDIYLVYKDNTNISFNVVTTLAPVRGDVQSAFVQRTFRSSISSYPGSKILSADIIKINGSSAFRVDFRVAQMHLGIETIKVFISILIVNESLWHILTSSAPLGGNIQTNTDLWETIFELVDSFNILSSVPRR